MVTSLQKWALSNDLKGVVAKIFPRFARIWYQYPECGFHRGWSHHCTGPHPRKIVLCMVVNMDPSQTSQINPTLFHYSLRASCKRKKGENEHYYFSEISGPWPPLIDRCHDAPVYLSQLSPSNNTSFFGAMSLVSLTIQFIQRYRAILQNVHTLIMIF